MMKKYRILLSGIGLLAILLVLASPGFAQGSDPTDDEVNAIASQLYCPVCENIPLDACGTAISPRLDRGSDQGLFCGAVR
jgi:cytochrome c-type biogenesis protein CcmH/NrfF